MKRTVVVGVGNSVRSDDGVGLLVVQGVQKLITQGEAEVVELMAGGLRLAEAIVGFDRAIIVDAMTTGEHPPGSVLNVGLGQLGPCRSVSCVHDANLPTALDLFRRAGEKMPESLSIVGIETLDTDTLCEELTAPVAKAVPIAVEAVLSLIREAGASG